LSGPYSNTPRKLSLVVPLDRPVTGLSGDMTGSRIVALGHYQPPKVLTNHDLAQLVETDDEWIRSRVGIRTRHIAEGESVADLAFRAAEKAVAASGFDASSIDLVVVATCTAIDRSPNTAAQVAARLGIAAPAAYDINTVCSGFSYALATADHAIRAGAATWAAVLGLRSIAVQVATTTRSIVDASNPLAATAFSAARKARSATLSPSAMCRVRMPTRLRIHSSSVSTSFARSSLVRILGGW
jgi:3-oxoacyl-(acyl-carrier-protein) synthase III